MKRKDILISVLVPVLTVVVLAAITSIVYWQIFWGNYRSYALGSLKHLKRSNSFYLNKRDATLRYLTAVYPINSFHKLKTLELAAFYNSLWFYYNCASKFKGGSLCWDGLPQCGSDKMPTLPYSPQGLLYSFKNYVSDSTTRWQPFIDSDSTMPPEDITGSVPGEAFGTFYQGPAPVWMYQRAIFRNIYSPSPALTVEPYGGALQVSAPVLQGSLETIQPSYRYPEKWWLGVPDNGYMEISGASEPGLPYSPPLCWFDGWVGSGVFYNVGKSKRVRNKINATFELSKEMSLTPEGAATLQKWFGSSDPYQVVKNVGFYGNPNLDSYNACNVPLTQSGKINDRGPIVASNNNVGDGKIQCNLCNNSWGQFSALPQTPAGWFNVLKESIPNWALWCPDVDASGNPVLSNRCVDAFMYGGSYKMDRLNNNISWDEPNFAMGVWLGYDSVQMTNSANGNGFWQYELMVLQGYPPETKNRDYSAFIQLVQDPNNVATTCDPISSQFEYVPKFREQYMNKVVPTLLSIRDPMDVNNKKRTMKCTTPIFAAVNPVNFGTDINVTCEENLSNMYTDLSVINRTPACGVAKPTC